MSFSDYMALALYHPEFGYYERPHESVGQKGDFITSVSVGPLFGELIWEACRDWMESLPNQAPVLLEAGAHDGRLALDILNHSQHHDPDRYALLRYIILEPSERRRSRQQAALKDHMTRVDWILSWDEIGKKSFEGVMLSNELLDALPTERIQWNAKERRWERLGVTLEAERLHWCRIPSAEQEVLQPFLDRFPPELAPHLPNEFLTEVGLAADQWWEQAASRLAHGYLVAFDYGLRQEEFFAPHRSQGTLRAYRHHRQSRDLLAHPGEQDITAHVNFSTLIATGEVAGLSTEGFTSQERFLTGLIQRLADKGLTVRFSDPKKLRQLQTLIHPDHFGRSFSVLVQSR